MITIHRHAQNESIITAEQRTEQTSVVNALRSASIEIRPHGTSLHVRAGASAIYRLLRGAGITATITDRATK